jgi:hypothetical protein
MIAPELVKNVLADSTDAYMVAKAAVALFSCVEGDITLESIAQYLGIPRGGAAATVLRALLEEDLGQRLSSHEAIQLLSAVASVDDIGAFFEDLYTKSFVTSPVPGMSTETLPTVFLTPHPLS